MTRPAPFVPATGGSSSGGSTGGTSGGSSTPPVVTPPSTGKSVSGKASWFGGSSDPQPMANGQSTPPVLDGVALWNVPLGTQVTVTSKQTGKSVTAPVVDRGPGTGPMANGVVIDLLPHTWDALGVPESQGLQDVTYTVASSTPAPPPTKPPVTPPSSGGGWKHHKGHKHPGTYVVVHGDWLAKIAHREYGDYRMWTKIYEANKAVIGSNANVIQPGMILRLP